MNEESQVRGCYNFYLHQPGNSVGSPLRGIMQGFVWKFFYALYKFSFIHSVTRRTGAQATAHTKRRPASAGTLGDRGRGEPSAQVLTLQIIRVVKLPPNQKRERTTGKKWFKGHIPGHTQCTWLHMRAKPYTIWIHSNQNSQKNNNYDCNLSGVAVTLKTGVDRWNWNKSIKHHGDYLQDLTMMATEKHPNTVLLPQIQTTGYINIHFILTFIFHASLNQALLFLPVWASWSNSWQLPTARISVK